MVLGMVAGALSALAIAFILNFCVNFYNHRRWFRGLPQPPHSFLWGHLKIMGEAAAAAPPDCHPQVYLTSIAQKYKLKGVFYIDLWPISTPMVVLIDPAVMTQVQVTQVLPMHPMSEDFMKPIVGPDNIASSNGAVWKLVHNSITPAFSWSHIRNLSAVVIDECDTFRSRLDMLAETEKTFSMETVGSQLIFDVIARIVYSFSLNAQGTGSQDLEDLRGMVKLAHVQLSWNPIAKFKAIFSRRALHRRLGVSVSTQIQQRLKVLTDDQIVPHRKNPHSILDLMLREHLEQEDLVGNKKNSTELSPEYMKILITNIKALLLGGQGTTSDTLCYIYMLLSKSPEVVAKLREEHTRVFAPSFNETIDILQTKPSKLDELDYTTAVIRETLRLFPIGFGVRQAADGATVAWNSTKYPIDNGIAVVSNAHSLHYDPEYFPSASTFNPERFIDPATAVHAKNNMWTFYRGPRACLGQNLAVDELRIILLETIRDYEFECVNLQPNEKQKVAWSDLDETFGDICFQKIGLGAQVRDGMIMRVKKVGTN